jgi:hypothetical protein
MPATGRAGTSVAPAAPTAGAVAGGEAAGGAPEITLAGARLSVGRATTRRCTVRGGGGATGGKGRASVVSSCGGGGAGAGTGAGVIGAGAGGVGVSTCSRGEGAGVGIGVGSTGSICSRGDGTAATGISGAADGANTRFTAISPGSGGRLANRCDSKITPASSATWASTAKATFWGEGPPRRGDPRSGGAQAEGPTSRTALARPSTASPMAANMPIAPHEHNPRTLARLDQRSILSP